MRTLIAIFKLSLFALLCLLILPTQGMMMLFFSQTKAFYILPRIFHVSCCTIFGLKTKLRGEIIHDKQVIYVGNHLSYLDIPVIGKLLPANFIAKQDVKSWPVFGWLAMIANTIFIERTRDAAEKSIRAIKASLDQGRSLILFPEGTSTDGAEVLPFKSGLFELFLNQKLKGNLIVQPFCITLTHTNGNLIKEQPDRDLYSWYADMTLPPHLWALAKSKGAQITVDFLAGRPASDFSNRKEFANTCHQDIADQLKNTLASALDFKDQAA